MILTEVEFLTDINKMKKFIVLILLTVCTMTAYSQYYFICSECNQTVTSYSKPKSGCCPGPGGKVHLWYNIGKVGTKNYVCKYCNTYVITDRQPSNTKCYKHNTHSWYYLGDYGKDVYMCSKCGVSVYSNRKPNTASCRGGGGHNWNKVGNNCIPGINIRK